MQSEIFCRWEMMKAILENVVFVGNLKQRFKLLLLRTMRIYVMSVCAYAMKN